MSIEDVTKAVTDAADGKFKCTRSIMNYADGGRIELFTCSLSTGAMVQIEVPAGTPNAEIGRLVVEKAGE
jgi:hypothetical protein